MKVSRTSIMSGIERTLEIPVTQEQLDAWHRGLKIQDAMPNLTPDQREFIMTGISPEEWHTLKEDEP